MTDLFDLKGKAAIVTGGNGGIGFGIARGLADAGADIAIVGRNEAKSKAAAAELAARGVRAISVVADVTDKAAVDSMVERIKRELGRIDILVNNAGINIRKAPHSLELEEWTSVIDTTAAIRSWPEVLAKTKSPGDAGASSQGGPPSDQYFATTGPPNW